MSDITQITTHVADALDRLILQYEDKPRMQALVSAFVNPLQRLEDAAFAVLVQSALDGAVGVQIDQIGGIVGEKRAGKIDADYKRFVSARIKVNFSDGKIDQLANIALLILGDAFPVEVRDMYPSAVEVEVQDCTVNAYFMWRDFLHKAKGSAKSLQLVYAKEADTAMLMGGSFYGDALTTAQDPGSTWTTNTGGGDCAGVFGEG